MSFEMALEDLWKGCGRKAFDRPLISPFQKVRPSIGLSKGEIKALSKPFQRLLKGFGLSVVKRPLKGFWQQFEKHFKGPFKGLYKLFFCNKVLKRPLEGLRFFCLWRGGNISGKGSRPCSDTHCLPEGPQGYKRNNALPHLPRKRESLAAARPATDGWF